MGIPVLLALGDKELQVGWINAEEISFYAAVISIGFLVSVAVSYSSDNVKSFRISLCSGMVTGFFAFMVVGFITGRDADGISGHIFYLALAALIGMSGKYQTAIIETKLKQLGLINDNQEKN